MGCGSSQSAAVGYKFPPSDKEKQSLSATQESKEKIADALPSSSRAGTVPTATRLPDVIPNTSLNTAGTGIFEKKKPGMEESTPPAGQMTGGSPGEGILQKQKSVERYDRLWTDPLEDVKKEIRERLCFLNKLEDFRSDACEADLLFLTACTRSKTADHRLKRNIFVDEMVKSNGIAVFCKVLEQNFGDGAFDGENPQAYKNMRLAVVTLWNGTDGSLVLCRELVQMEYYKVLLQYLDHPILKPEELEDIKPLYLAKGFFGILHNCLQNCDIREALRSANAVHIFNKFRSAKNLMLKCKAEFNLSYLLTEEENAQLNANAENIKFMEKILSSALNGQDHYSKKYGYRANEVVSALNKLAANDDNKVKMAEEGLLKHYAELLNPETSSETDQLLAAKGLWVLSFKVKQQIKDEEGCLTGLKRLAQEGSSKELQDAAKGALWILEGKDDVSVKEAVAEMQAKEAEQVSTSEQGHVMISYQWDTKPVMLQLRDRLRNAGYTVWMDVDNMSGSILEAMADAVEKACVVVICLSQKYKESPNCRTEAEYAYRLQKKIVPLLLQRRYRPDGWLGAIAGNRLYFDLSQEKKFDHSIESFLKEIHMLCGSKVVEKTIEQTLTELPSNPVKLQNASNWSESKVADWLNEHGLSNRASSLTGMDGSLLLELRSMYHHAPEFFYTSLRDQMKFSLLEILKFTKAIKTLS